LSPPQDLPPPSCRSVYLSPIGQLLQVPPPLQSPVPPSPWVVMTSPRCVCGATSVVCVVCVCVLVSCVRTPVWTETGTVGCCLCGGEQGCKIIGASCHPTTNWTQQGNRTHSGLELILRSYRSAAPPATRYNRNLAIFVFGRNHFPFYGWQGLLVVARHVPTSRRWRRIRCWRRTTGATRSNQLYKLHHQYQRWTPSSCWRRGECRCKGKGGQPNVCDACPPPAI
jgi:hypothetical protein